MPEENLYPSLLPSGDSDSAARVVDQQEMHPLNEIPLVSSDGRSTVPVANGNNGSAHPRRKVKFLQKLLNFCGDPKRRQQTCSRRNKTLTLCKERIIVCGQTEDNPGEEFKLWPVWGSDN